MSIMPSRMYIPPHTGRIYTDTRGRVVFADWGFAELFRHESPANPIGVPLHEVLCIEPSAADLLLNVRDEEQRELLVRRPGSPPTQAVLVTCRAAYNAYQKLVGANLLLARTLTPSRARLYVPDRGRLQGYFTEQIDSLQVLVGRIGGPALRQTLEKHFNRTATGHTWPLYLQNGLLVFEQPIDLAPIYGDLLKEAMSYAISVAGERLVVAEMERVHQNADQRTQALAEQFGLPELFRSNNSLEL